MHEKGHCFSTVSLFRAHFRAAVPRKGGENKSEVVPVIVDQAVPLHVR